MPESTCTNNILKYVIQIFVIWFTRHVRPILLLRRGKMTANVCLLKSRYEKEQRVFYSKCYQWWCICKKHCLIDLAISQMSCKSILNLQIFKLYLHWNTFLYNCHWLRHFILLSFVLISWFSNAELALSWHYLWLNRAFTQTCLRKLPIFHLLLPYIISSKKWENM